MSFKEFVEKEKDKAETLIKEDAKHIKDFHVTFTPTSNLEKISDGKRHFIDKNLIEMEQEKDSHLVYFGSGDEQKMYFKLLDYKWDGPKYKEYYVTQTSTSGAAHTHRTHHLLGAAVGTLIAPGAGTLIGGLAGLGSKTDNQGSTTTVAVPEQEEIPSPATITLENEQTKEIFTVTFDCTKSLDAAFRKFYRFEPPAVPEEQKAEADNMDPFEEMKKMKEMLDMGIISQEEFDEKKKELLGV